MSLPGVVDVAGPRPDGALVAAAAGRLVLVHPDGTTSPFGTYATDPGPESYIAMAGGVEMPGLNCGWQAGDVYALELSAQPPGVVRVTATGQPSRFVDTPQVDSLGGIAFDGTGRFGNALLVAGRRGDKTVVLSIDCRGKVRVLTDSAPPMEGGMAVAPQKFGDHGGDLIGVDENSGNIVFIRYDGTSGVLLASGLPAGGDVGVESVGFIPPEFVHRGGAAYVADRRSPGSPTGGNDTIWRMSGTALTQAGIDDNDLVVATEGGGRTIVVRCRTTCRIIPLGQAGNAHVEGHVTVVVDPPPPPHPLRARANRIGTAVFWASTVVVIVGALALYLVHARRREPAGG